jgi:hypothetical protein
MTTIIEPNIRIVREAVIGSIIAIPTPSTIKSATSDETPTTFPNTPRVRDVVPVVRV